MAAAAGAEGSRDGAFYATANAFVFAQIRAGMGTGLRLPCSDPKMLSPLPCTALESCACPPGQGRPSTCLQAHFCEADALTRQPGRLQRQLQAPAGMRPPASSSKTQFSKLCPPVSTPEASGLQVVSPSPCLAYSGAYSSSTLQKSGCKQQADRQLVGCKAAGTQMVAHTPPLPCRC